VTRTSSLLTTRHLTTREFMHLLQFSGATHCLHKVVLPRSRQCRSWPLDSESAALIIADLRAALAISFVLRARQKWGMMNWLVPRSLSILVKEPSDFGTKLTNPI
jgi:hypothetical protein